MKKLLGINCAYNYREEHRDCTTTMSKCYSTTCMMNTDKEIARKIQENGCVIYQKDFVQEEIKDKECNEKAKNQI